MEIFSVKVPELGTYKIGNTVNTEYGNQFMISTITAQNGVITLFCEEGIVAQIVATSYETIYKQPF